MAVGQPTDLDREYFIVAYESDPEAIRAAAPEPFTPILMEHGRVGERAKPNARVLGNAALSVLRP